MKRGRCCVIRNGHELYVLRERLTAAERAEVEKRERLLGARRRFGVLLRQVRKTALDAKL
jgi:hypothetical protein